MTYRYELLTATRAYAGSLRRMANRMLCSLFLAAITMQPASAFEQFIDAIDLDVDAATVTLPLFRGQHDGDDVWYIITEISNRDQAEQLGVNFAPKIANALGTPAVQQVTERDDGIVFRGSVDFSPERQFEPGPDGFPPANATPGATADSDYSPLITLGDGIVINAPQVANASGLHDQVADIDFAGATVTMRLVDGFYNGKEVLYLTTDSGDANVAALEGHTFAPNVNASPGIASNSRSSSRSALIPVVNGATGVGNPDRQGLQSAAFGEGDALNNLQTAPGGGNPRYSPLWDVHPLVWTDAAIANGERERLTSVSEIRNAVDDGLAVSGGNGPRNSRLEGLRAAGFVVNCPVVVEL